MYVYGVYVISLNILHPFTRGMLIALPQCLNIKISFIYQIPLMNPVEHPGIIWDREQDNGFRILWKQRDVFAGARRRIWTSISPTYADDLVVRGWC